VNIGIVCYASVGGSGIVATELATCLAERGHDIHLISSDPPFRLRHTGPHLAFHRVEMPAYPLFREPQYLLALTNTIVRVARLQRLDLVHAHYAVPHATAGYLARQILTSGGGPVPKVITTLHGTDITLVGSDPSYAETVAFCIDQSDRVTAVSESLKTETYRSLPVRQEITVIPNFLDCQRYRRIYEESLRRRLCPPGRFEKLVMHASNFRPVKRVDAVIAVFREIRRRVPAKLVLVGEGPDLARAQSLVDQEGLAESVDVVGEQDDMVALLSTADLFLLPSAQESFGLAALEAMACEAPVVASRVGGLPEVIEDGVEGFLHLPDDLPGMAASGIRLLTDPVLHRRIALAASRKVRERFCAEHVVPRYEALYSSLYSHESTAGLEAIHDPRKTT
jgi:N-acetyl-alpha-D-glucosaminyl L-malate synthase BshA